jgi:hypothetical protein
VKEKGMTTLSGLLSSVHREMSISIFGCSW